MRVQAGAGGKHASAHHASAPHQALMSNSMDDFNEGEMTDEASVSEDDHTNEYTNSCRWHAPFTESVYDDAIIKCLTIGNEKHSIQSGNHLRLASVWVQLVFVLIVNFALQGVVVTRVHKINKIYQDQHSQIFGLPLSDVGSCFQRDPATIPIFLPQLGAMTAKPALHKDTIWDCGPLAPVLMSNVTILDVNGDGHWSLEDVHASGTKFSNMLLPLGKLPGNFSRIFTDLMADVSNFIAVKGKLSDTQIDTQTAKRTRIPMTWMREEQGVLALCNNVNAHLCGNLEARGVLQTLKLRNDPVTGIERIDECHAVFEWCGDIFGETFHHTSLKAHEICGKMETEWYQTGTTDGFNVNMFAKSNVFSPSLPNAVTNLTYLSFLWLILVIWWLMVVSELREVCGWMAVLVLISTGDHHTVRKEEEDGTKTVTSISLWRKCWAMTFIVIPRFIIAVALAVVGTEFLINSDNYSELILNSVALGFICEVDEMLYAALMSREARERLNNCNPLTAEHQCCHTWCCWHLNHPACHTSFPILVGVVSIVAVSMAYAVLVPSGMFGLSLAFDCFCQAEGATCLAAQIFGALTRIPVDGLGDGMTSGREGKGR